MSHRSRIMVGITGATGTASGARVLEFLRAADIETHLVVSKAGHLTRSDEIDLSARDLEAPADVSWSRTPGFGSAVPAVRQGTSECEPTNGKGRP